MRTRGRCGQTSPVTRLRTASPYLLGALLCVAGSLHFLFPRTYDGIIPSFLPVPRVWTYASGVAEVACGLGILTPRYRRGAAAAAGVLFLAVLPANVQMAVRETGAARYLGLARLPLQLPLIYWAWCVRRAAPTLPFDNAHPLRDVASGGLWNALSKGRRGGGGR